MDEEDGNKVQEHPVESSETTPLERHLIDTGVMPDDPGRQLVRALTAKRGSTQPITTPAPPPVKSRRHDYVADMAIEADDPQIKKLANKYVEYQTFFAEQLDMYAAQEHRYKSAAAKKQSLEKRGKLLVYNRLSEAHQRLLQESRLKEWQNYMKFGAVKVISRQEMERLIGLGAEVLPTQWIETDKNEPLRTAGDINIEPRMKSRLVARGDLEKGYGRTDSPTLDNEGAFIILSWAAANKLVIKSSLDRAQQW